MKKEKYLNLLLGLMIIIATSLSFTSCSDDDDDYKTTTEEEGGGSDNDKPLANPAGDDFYMHINGSWHKSLNGSKQHLGYSIDVAEELGKKTEEIMEEENMFKMLIQSLANVNYKKKEGETLVDGIIEELISDIENHDDAFYALGKSMSLGVDALIRPRPIDTDNNSIGFYIHVDESVLGGDGNYEEYGHFKKYRIKKINRAASQTRSDNTSLNHMLKGLGFDADYYVHEPAIDTLIKVIRQLPLDDVVEIIGGTIEASLKPYCADTYVKELTEGQMTTVKQYFEEEVEKAIVYPLSYYFAKKYVTPELKQSFKDYGEELKAVFVNRIENNTWLSATTKTAALDKLSKMGMSFGEPDQWFDEGMPNPQGKLLVSDMMELKQSSIRLLSAILGKNKYEHSLTLGMLFEDPTPLYDYNAYYLPMTNSINILPAFMMAPEYDPEMNYSEMYSTFYVIGHEMTHGFDLEGALYDAEGKEVDWWTAEDKAMFQVLNDNFIDHLNKFYIAPGIKTDASRTITEDVADLGGLNIAFDALNNRLAGLGLSEAEIIDEQKNFFVHHAYRNRTNYSNEELIELQSDVHSAATIRVNGIVQHMDMWYKLFDVTEKDKLYLPANERIYIW